MQLPNAARARVDRRKITEYLLSPSHPDGRAKAAFFRAVGFRLEDWQSLAQAFRDLAVTFPVTDVMESEFGTRYTVDGALATPEGRSVWVRTVWLIGPGSESARLITAFPSRARR